MFFLKQQVDATAMVTLITKPLMDNIILSKETALMFCSKKSSQDTISVSTLKTIFVMLKKILPAQSMSL